MNINLYMSTVRKSYPLVLEIFVGSQKTYLITIDDPDTNEPLDLSNESTYDTGNFKIIKPDGTLIATLSITYADRTNGVISFTVTDTITTNTNAGNWTGNVELIDDSSTIVEQQVLNFNILENF